MALIIAGQLAAVVLLDHFGWIVIPIREVGGVRLPGVVLVLLGAFLVTRF